MIVKSKSVLQTNELAKKIAKYIQGGDIILLNGDLGAGKTTFVKGFAKAKGIMENVTSPTFTLLKTYKCEEYTLVHIDAYRLDGQSFSEIDDYLTNDNVLFIEWASCLNNQSIFDSYLQISIQYISLNQRRYIIEGKGERFIKMVKELEND